MKVFKVEITETLRKVVEIEAESQDEADTIARERYSNEDIVLDYSDFMDVEFRDGDLYDC